MGYERRKEVLHNAIRGWVNYFKCGIPQWRAYQWGNASKGYWAVAHSGIMQVAASNRNLARAGYPSLLGYYEKYHRM